MAAVLAQINAALRRVPIAKLPLTTGKPTVGVKVGRRPLAKRRVLELSRLVLAKTTVKQYT